MEYHSIDFKKCEERVGKLQDRIARAHKENDLKAVRTYQNRLIHDFSARALAVKKVTSNPGKSTPGVDGITGSSPKSKGDAIMQLKVTAKKYKASPLKRVYIPKPGKSEKRPLGIPTMLDRAYQDLVKLSVDPIAENKADPHSYGFRVEKSAQDAMAYLKILLSNPRGAEGVLEADIKGFFDNIDHKWILREVKEIDPVLLEKWLKCGIIHNGKGEETTAGTPQGGIISPVIANMVLDGLEEKCMKSVAKWKRTKNENGKYTQTSSSIHVTRYADDFVVTAKRKEDLKEHVLPAIVEHLAERQLELRGDKTRIVHISEGFDFLGGNFRRYPKIGNDRGTILVKPSKKSVLKVSRQIRDIAKENVGIPQEALIKLLNPVLRGFANYHRATSAKKTFSKISRVVGQSLFGWAKTKHPKLGLRKLKEKYFKKRGKRDWIFTTGNYQLYEIALTPIGRHILCRDLNPFMLENAEYYRKRKLDGSKRSCLIDIYGKSVLRRQNYTCPVCTQVIGETETYEIHHIQRVSDGGNNKLNNLLALHYNCHKQVTHSKSPTLKAEFKTKGIIA